MEARASDLEFERRTPGLRYMDRSRRSVVVVVFVAVGALIVIPLLLLAAYGSFRDLPSATQQQNHARPQQGAPLAFELAGSDASQHAAV